MVRLQELHNRKQKKKTYTLSVPKDIVELLNLSKGDDFAVNFDEEKGTIEYVRIQKKQIGKRGGRK